MKYNLKIMKSVSGRRLIPETLESLHYTSPYWNYNSPEGDENVTFSAPIPEFRSIEITIPRKGTKTCNASNDTRCRKSIEITIPRKGTKTQPHTAWLIPVFSIEITIPRKGTKTTKNPLNHLLCGCIEITIPRKGTKTADGQIVCGFFLQLKLQFPGRGRKPDFLTCSITAHRLKLQFPGRGRKQVIRRILRISVWRLSIPPSRSTSSDSESHPGRLAKPVGMNMYSDVESHLLEWIYGRSRIHLKGGLTSLCKEKYHAVYCWQEVSASDSPQDTGSIETIRCHSL